MEKIIIDKNLTSSVYHNCKVIFDIIMALIICLAPFLIFLHLFFSEESNKISLYFLEFSHKYPDNQVFAWSLLVSFIPFVLILTIYFTTNKGWRYFLIPLLIVLYLSCVIVFTNTWEEHKYLQKIDGQIWVAIFLENIFFYDNLIFKRHRIWRLKIVRKDLWDELIYRNYDKLNRKVKEIILSKDMTSLQHYICRIYYILQILNRKTPRYLIEVPLEKTNFQFNRSDVGKGLLIISTTLLLFTHTLVPNNVYKLDFLTFEIGSFGFNTLHTFVWYASHRLSLLIIFSWCFIHCEQWWRWSLLSPIIFYSYQLWEIFIKMRIDEIQNILYLSPLLLLILLIHLLSRSIREQYRTYHYKIMIENELESQIAEASKIKEN